MMRAMEGPRVVASVCVAMVVGTGPATVSGRVSDWVLVLLLPLPLRLLRLSCLVLLVLPVLVLMLTPGVQQMMLLLQELLLLLPRLPLPRRWRRHRCPRLPATGRPRCRAYYAWPWSSWLVQE